MLTIKTPSKGLVSHGISFCHGCGLEIAGRVIFSAMDKNTVVCIPPGCAALFSGYGIETSVRIPGFQGNLECTAAYAAGIKAGFEVQGKNDITVMGLAGDGATVDIGLQALSGALERGDKILYICYDNEAYMNTGIQGSASTPLAAWTTTTPSGKGSNSKHLMEIVMAHRIPYAASASIAHIEDLRKKVVKAKEATKTGPAFIHVHIPCPTGWGIDPAKAVEVARLAVNSKCWLLMESEGGIKLAVTRVKNPVPVEEYLKSQRRFRGFKAEQLEAMQQYIDREYNFMLARSEIG